MAVVNPQTSNEHTLLVKATAPRYYKIASDLTFRKRLWLAMLMRYGQVEYNATSFSCTWDVEKSQPEIRQYGDSGDLEFSEHDALDQYTVDVRGYTATDRLSLKKELMNRGPTQIDDLKKNKPIRLVKRMRQVICAELYVDGQAANNTNRFEGIQTFTGDDGNTVAADLIANPSDTYGGVSTAVNQGGTWTSAGVPALGGAGNFPNATIARDWPYGNGDVDFDFSSPLLINISSTNWGTNSTKWLDNCEVAMRRNRIWQISRGCKGDDQRVPYMHMLAPDLYADFLDHYSSRNRQIVPHNEADNLGFSDTMNFEGDMVHHEFDTPAGTGYGISPTMMEMFLLGPQLIASLDDFSLSKLGTLFLVYTFGNLRFQPRAFSRYAAYA